VGGATVPRLGAAKKPFAQGNRRVRDDHHSSRVSHGTDTRYMEWLIVLPLLFFLPAAHALWQKRRIAAGSDVEITFDMLLPSQWAAELTQRALDAEGVRARIFREGRDWLCSVVRPMKYERADIEKAVRHFDQMAVARGGNCLRYKIVLGKREEQHACEPMPTRI